MTAIGRNQPFANFEFLNLNDRFQKKQTFRFWLPGNLAGRRNDNLISFVELVIS